MEEGAAVVAFSIGGTRYGVNVSEVLAIVPRIQARHLDGTPAWVEGLMSVSGDVVPLVDLVQLQTGAPARRAFSTRVILVRYPVAGGGTRPLGLVAEQVTDIMAPQAGSVRPAGVRQADAPWLGQIGRLPTTELVQFVTVRELLPDEVRAVLFPDSGEKG